MLPDQLAKSNTEHAHQRAFFAWLNYARLYGFYLAHGVCSGDITPEQARQCTDAKVEQPELALFHAIPNGGARDKVTAGKLKAEGVKPGVFDTFLPVPRKFTYPINDANGVQVETGEAWYMGLYLEFKEPGRKGHKQGGLSDVQCEFMDAVSAQGYCTRVAYTWREGANLTMQYYGANIRFDTT